MVEPTHMSCPMDGGAYTRVMVSGWWSNFNKLSTVPRSCR